MEFGTRLDHSVWYESPKLFHNIFSFDLLWSPGQNRTFDNVVQSAGSPDCSGGNEPGSGNLPLNCDDGGFSDAYSADLKFEWRGLYAIAAWEEHRAVNRNSDGIGSNHPLYNYLLSVNSPLLDFNTFNNYSAEFPGYATVATPGYLTDIGDEIAYKLGAKYTFPMGLSVSAIWESCTVRYRRRSNSRMSALAQDGGSQPRRTCSVRGTMSVSAMVTPGQHPAIRVESTTTIPWRAATPPTCTPSRGSTSWTSS